MIVIIHIILLSDGNMLIKFATSIPSGVHNTIKARIVKCLLQVLEICVHNGNKKGADDV